MGHLRPTAWRRKGTAALAAVLVGLCGLVFDTAAQTSAETGGSRAKVGNKLKKSQQSLEQIRKREARIRNNLKTVEQERAQINAQLIDTARRVQAGETKLSEIEERLGELDEQRKLISGSLARQHESIGDLLSALQRMGRNPPPVMITQRADALEMVRSAMLLSSVFPELKDKATALSNRLTDLDRVASEIKTQGDQLRQQNKLLAQAEDRLDDLMHTKKTRIVQTQQELNDVRRIAEAQAKSVRNLGELIARLDKTVHEKSGLGSYERELEEGRAPGQDVAILVPEPTVPKQPTVARPAIEPPTRAPDQPSASAPRRKRTLPTIPKAEPKPATKPRRVARSSPGRLKPSIPFSRAKGRLPAPASGRRIFSFGGKTRFGGRSKGIAIETRSRAQITSPNDGWVVYAGPFRSYGQLLIINAGGGYHVLLAGMERINVTIGQFVLAGEPVGKMRVKSKKAGSKSQVAAPILYVEFRKKGRPINPDPWWVKGSG